MVHRAFEKSGNGKGYWKCNEKYAWHERNRNFNKLDANGIAIFLCEIKNLKFRRFVQTFTTVPNFISWVLVYSIATCIFSTDGFLNSAC